MARFYLTAINGRGNRQSIGGRASVESAHVRGWNAGIEVECIRVHDLATGTETDRFDVYMTPGSTGEGHRVLVGQAYEPVSKRDGRKLKPRWKPAKGRKSTR